MTKQAAIQGELISDVATIVERIGRQEMRDKLGASPSSISNAVRDKKMPGWWFGTLEPLAEDKGFTLCRSAFNWRKAGAT